MGQLARTRSVPHHGPLSQSIRTGNWYGLVLDSESQAQTRSWHYVFSQRSFTEISGPAGDLAALMDFVSREITRS